MSSKEKLIERIQRICFPYTTSDFYFIGRNEEDGKKICQFKIIYFNIKIKQLKNDEIIFDEINNVIEKEEKTIIGLIEFRKQLLEKHNNREEGFLEYENNSGLKYNIKTMYRIGNEIEKTTEILKRCGRLLSFHKLPDYEYLNIQNDKSIEQFIYLMNGYINLEIQYDELEKVFLPEESFINICIKNNEKIIEALDKKKNFIILNYGKENMNLDLSKYKYEVKDDGRKIIKYIN